MADEFLGGVQIGANIANMRIAQQERMMQLRSQAALNAIHERQLAAQATMLSQHAELYKQQMNLQEEKNKERNAYLAASVDLIHQKVQESDGDVTEGMKQAFPALNALSPELADQAMNSYAKIAVPEMQTQAMIQRQALQSQGAIEKQQLANQGKRSKLTDAEDIANLRMELDASKKLTDNAGEMSPDVQSELNRQKFLQYKLDALQGSGVTGKTTPLTINEKRLTDLENELDDAVKSGDTEKAQRLQEHINYVKQQHRDPILESQLADVKARRLTVYRELILTDPGSSKGKRLQKRMDALDAEMKALTGPATVPMPGQAAGPGLKRRVFQNGQFIDQ